MEAVEGPIALIRCTNEILPSPRCPLQKACIAHPHWEKLNEELRTLFQKVTLESFF